MKNKRLSFLLAVLCVISLLLTSCAETDKRRANAFTSDNELSSVATGAKAQNSNCQLIWDENRQCVLMALRSGQVYGTMPYDAYLNPPEYGLSMVNFNSPIVIDYVDPNNGQVGTNSSYIGVTQDGRISVKSIKKGIRVEYYFDREEIMVPIEYVLRDFGIEVKIIVSDIQENKFLLTKVAVTPYFANAKNNTDGFVFVPSGSGAVMSIAEDGNKKIYSEAVYGEDAAQTKYYNNSNFEDVKLPVFGVKAENGAILGIVEKGVEKAFINAETGNDEVGYSCAYASFQLRGSDTLQLKQVGGLAVSTTVWADELISDEYVSVCYYPLSGEDASIAGMAKRYREYLYEKGLKKSVDNDPLLYVNLIGGALVDKQVLGFPITSLFAATTFEDAKKITNELNEAVGDKGLLVNLVGFGKNGLDPKTYAGGMTISSKLGGKTGYKELNKLCDDKNISLFMDFDLIRFRSGGSGVSSLTDIAKTANAANAVEYVYNYETVAQNKKIPANKLIARDKLFSLAEKLQKKTAKMGITGVSLSGISDVAYSDGENYSVKHNMAEDTQKIIKLFEKQKVLSVNANAYAAAVSDYLMSAPTKSSKFDSLAYDVPFYQMVFKGVLPISSTPINLASNMREEFLKAISTGSALCFSTYNNYDDLLRSSRYTVFQSGEYNIIKNSIISFTEEAEEFFSLVSGAEIIDYSLEGKVAHTVFDNGIEVYVNYSDNAVSTPLGEVKAEGFRFSGEGL